MILVKEPNFERINIGNKLNYLRDLFDYIDHYFNRVVVSFSEIKFTEIDTKNMDKDVCLFGLIFSEDTCACNTNNGRCSHRYKLILPKFFGKDFINISDIKDYELYNGQKIIVKGKLVNDILYPTYIKTDLSLPVSDPPDINKELNKSIVIVSGPFVRDNLDTTIKIALNIRDKNPDITILIGPFVVDDCPLLAPDPQLLTAKYTALELTQVIFRVFSRRLPICYMISSPDDSISLPIIPTPRILDSGDNFYSLSNPSTISIDNFNISIISNDLETESERKDERFVDTLVTHFKPGIYHTTHSNFLIEKPQHIIVSKGKIDIQKRNKTYILSSESVMTCKSFHMIYINGGEAKCEVVNCLEFL